MQNILVLINEVYPYGNDESFLETEISHLKLFDKVLIFPCSAYESDIMRVTPENVKAYCPKQTKSRFIKICRYILAVFKKLTIKEIIRLVRIKKFGFEALRSLLSFVSIAEKNIKEIKSKLSENKIDKLTSVVFYSYWMHFHSYIAIKLKQKYPNSIAISRCHGFDLYEYRNKLDYIPLRPWILEHLDKIFSISRDGKSYLENRYSNCKTNIQVSRLGTLDYGVNSINIKKRPFKVVSCSWVLPVKRLDRIIGALSQLTGLEIHWTHIGDGELLNEIKRYAEKKLPSNIMYEFKGAISNKEIMSLYKTEDAHIFVNVSESEGIPVSIMEAMSFGIPTIATNVGGVNEIVIDGYNGYLLSKDFSNNELALKIKEVCHMKERDYQQLRFNSRSYWEQNYNQSRNYQEFTKIMLGE